MIASPSLRYFAFAAVLSLGLGAATAQGNSNVVRVDINTPAAADLQDGTSWATAYRYLQDGLASASFGQEIWVADGVYYPDVDAEDDSGSRNESFEMVEGVSMFGGFAGAETQRDERNPFVHLCILSGDIDQDDLQQPIANHVHPQSGDENNAKRVVDMSDYDDEETVDGFVITAGRADHATRTEGGGVYCKRKGRIKNCWITGNYASQKGGGLYIEGTKSFIANCRVNGNVSGAAGGGLYAHQGKVRFFNCEFRGNRATQGGGIYLGNATLKLINCAVSGNSAENRGGGFRMAGGTLVVANSTVTGNHTDGPGGAVHVTGSKAKPRIRNAVIWNNHGGGSTASPTASFHIGNSKGNPKITNSLVANSGGSAGWNGSAGIDQGSNLDLEPTFFTPITPSPQPTDAGVFYLRAGSVGIDAGLEAYLLIDSADLDADADTFEYVPHDLEGNPRVVGDEVDMGAYEFDAAHWLDSDGDGLSDLFELTHQGDPLSMTAWSDEDGDRVQALGEFLHGADPGEGGVPSAFIGTTEESGTSYLTLTFFVDPAASDFVGYTVERAVGGEFFGPWQEGQTVEISSMPSNSHVGLLEVTHRSLVPLGQEEREFLRLCHWVRNPGGIVIPPYNPDDDGLIPGVNNWGF